MFKSESQIEIKKTSGSVVNTYNAELLPKELRTYDDMIAINLGSEINFIRSNGWLIKKYTSSRNIKDVIICGTLAGIVYKDKVELINL